MTFLKNRNLGSRYVPILLIGGAILLLARAYLGMSFPLDWDELDTLTRLVSPDLCPVDETHVYRSADVLNPLTNTRNHTVANLFSLALVKALGVNEFIARLPSLGFFAFFLVLIATRLRPVATLPTLTLVGAHLFANGMLSWYWHSLRGYASMIFFTTLLLLLFLNPPRGRWVAPVSFLVGVTAGLCHTFGNLYVLLLGGSFVIYRRFFSDRRADAVGFGVVAAAPVLLFVAGKQFFFLSRIGFLFTPANVVNQETMLSVLGIAQRFGIYPLAALLLALFCFRVRRPDFTTIFVGLSAVAIFGLVRTMRVTLFEGRFLLAFVVPLVIWTGESIALIPSPAGRRIFAAMALVTFVIFPAAGSSQMLQMRSGQMSDFSRFVLRTRMLVEKTPNACLLFSGEPEQMRFARGIYFSADQRSVPICPYFYQLHFARDWRGERNFAPLRKGDVTLAYDDGLGRTLYKIVDNQRLVHREAEDGE